ncbi:phenylalanine--tRNA ligase subunit beta [Candidatus Saganbacteria bacterium]|nr:phenylalanine--tRNA ligase subunit beta [Candidatus Saganbacteria bacterium]
MKIPLEWLKDLVEVKMRPQELQARLTMAGLEVGALEGEVLDIDVLPNRGDCLSILGVAREVSAVTNTKLKKPANKFAVKSKRDGSTELAEVFSLGLHKMSIEVKDKELCPRYMARMIEKVSVGESPEWLKKRLVLAGLRPINNIVDATNYVLMELGQPLHAFDAGKIGGQKIVVRRAKPGEKIITLDGMEHKLGKDTLAIADDQRPIALAGVMGGANTEVSASTTSVLLESAYFDPTSINKTSKAAKLRTEASIRFEKGVDWERVEQALDRAAALIAELSGGKVTGYKVDIKSRDRKPKILELRQERLNRVLGTTVPLSEAAKILVRLGFTRLRQGSGGQGKLKVGVPLWRAGDIEREIDLIEEVARLRGYDRIPTTLPRPAGEVREDRKYAFLKKIKEILVGCGLYEAQTFTLVDPQMAGEEAVKLANPMAPEESVLRTEMLPSLLRAVSYNLRRQVEDVKLFEIGKVFLEPRRSAAGSIPAGKPRGSLTEERLILAGASTNLDFLGLKGIVENLLNELTSDWKLESTAKREYHPGQSAAVIGKSGKLLGTFGRLHPELKPEGVLVFEFDIDALLGEAQIGKRYKPLPKYPKVERDLAMFVPPGVTSGQIILIIRQAGGNIVEEVRLFDIFKNSQAYRISFRDPERTLTDEVVNRAFLTIQDELTGKLKVQIRK